MPSPQQDRFASSPSQTSVAIRVGAGLFVLAAHAAVIAAVFLNDTSRPEMLEPEAVMVSVIEAPVPEVAQAQPQPEPPVEQPPVEEPPPPEPPVEEPPPPEPEPEIEPEPEPEPVIEKPPEPAPKPKPKPKPRPKPKPKPQPKPVETPPPPPKPVETPPPTGAVDGDRVNQAPRQAPQPQEPVMMTNVEYLGARPSPAYPMTSRRLREEGRVVVLVEINTEGLVERATIDASSGFSRLDESALAAARKARFKPLMRNGVAYPARAKLPFDFIMRN